MSGGKSVDYSKKVEAAILQSKRPYCYACHRKSNDYLEYPIDFCCEDLKGVMHECRIPVLYDEEKRKFTMPHKKDAGFEVLVYCPWCGTDLGSLSASI